MSKEELHNFGRNRAKVAIGLAKLNNFWAIGWRLIIPEPILEISRRRITESTKRIACDDTGIDKNDIRVYAEDIEGRFEAAEQSFEELKLCWIFLAKAGIHSESFTGSLDLFPGCEIIDFRFIAMPVGRESLDKAN